jgi:hypothetical protein
MLQIDEQQYLNRYQLMKMLRDGETIPFERIRITGVCSRCYERVGSRMRSDDPHLINIYSGVIHGYGNWSDTTACKQDCTGPTWCHKL